MYPELIQSCKKEREITVLGLSNGVVRGGRSGEEEAESNPSLPTPGEVNNNRLEAEILGELIYNVSSSSCIRHPHRGLISGY